MKKKPSDLIRPPASLSHTRDGGVLGCRFGGGGWVIGLPVLWWWQWVETLFSLSSSQSLLAGIKTFRSSPWVANVDVVYSGQSGRWVLRRHRCLGWGLVDAIVWGLRFGIWVASPPTVKWVWALGFGFLRQQNGFGRWDVEVCFC
ncbi:hypothetical protein FCV25MIE_29383 [Fagus crenata]